MENIRHMVKDGDAWEDGTIMDQENGKECGSERWVKDIQLQVPDYEAVFFRKQNWLRA